MLKQQTAPMDAAARIKATVIATRICRALRAATHRWPSVATGHIYHRTGVSAQRSDAAR